MSQIEQWFRRKVERGFKPLPARTTVTYEYKNRVSPRSNFGSVVDIEPFEAFEFRSSAR
jgi:hypothetical protein